MKEEVEIDDQHESGPDYLVSCFDFNLKTEDAGKDEELISSEKSSKPCKEPFTEYQVLPDVQTNGNEQDTPEKQSGVITGRRFLCPICCALFTAEEDFESHKRLHYSRTYFCKYCNRIFSIVDFKLHKCKQDVKKDTRKYTCKDCGANFLSYQNFYRHVIEHGNNDSTNADEKSTSNVKGKKYVKKDIRKYTCKECGTNFLSYKNFYAHVIEHGNNGSTNADEKATLNRLVLIESPYKCDICGKCLSSRNALGGHLKRHNNIRDIKCSDCDKTFYTSGGLLTHLKTHSDLRPFKCEDCGKSFKTRRHLKRHSEIHSGELPYSCSECGQRFSQRGYLIYHLKYHNQDKPFKCEDCDIGFCFARDLGRHVKTHAKLLENSLSVTGTADKIANIETSSDISPTVQSSEKFGKTYEKKNQKNQHHRIKKNPITYICDTCGKNFKYQKSLTKHVELLYCKKQVEVHNNKKNYQCTECGLTFTGLNNLKSHSFVHKSNAQFLKCNDCGFTFVSEDYLRVHIEKNHNADQDKRVQCETCGITVSQIKDLKVHMKRHSNIRAYKCKDCDKTFNTSGTLYQHKKSHSDIRPYLCNECGKGFKSRRGVKRHSVTHTGELAFSCSQCGQRFSQKSHLGYHLKTHSQEKPFKCEKCDKSYYFARDLGRHVKTHAEMST